MSNQRVILDPAEMRGFPPSFAENRRHKVNRLGARVENDRATIQQVYIRVCRDSGFNLDMYRAASLAADMLGTHPLLIWLAMPSIDVMEQIARCEHPAALSAPSVREVADGC